LAAIDGMDGARSRRIDSVSRLFSRNTATTASRWSSGRAERSILAAAGMAPRYLERIGNARPFGPRDSPCLSRLPGLQCPDLTPVKPDEKGFEPCLVQSHHAVPDRRADERALLQPPLGHRRRPPAETSTPPHRKKGCLGKLLRDARVARYLAQNHPEFLGEFQTVAEITSAKTAEAE